MRELKFRAWVNEHWADWIPTCKTLGAYNASVIDTDGYTFEEDNPFIVEQYTGLTDKNGKEIYEGDIFRNTINGGTWRVSWNEKDAAFWIDSGVAGCSLGEFDWDRSNRKYGFIRKNCEVIGNVHESNMEELCPKE